MQAGCEFVQVREVMRFLAFDVGGTRIKAGLVELDRARVVDRRTVPTPARAEDALAAVAEIGRALLASGGRVAGLGLCVPGLVDSDGRIAALPGKLDGIVGRDLVALFSAQFDVRPVVLNDAIAFGLGEARFGAGRGRSRVLVVTIGTGVGVCVVEAGRPLGEGMLGGGLLGGQVPVFEDPDGPVDTNGRRGTIEARCAAQRIVSAAQRHGSDALDVPAVFAGAACGKAAERAGVAAYRSDLRRSLVALAHAHAPERIVLGGGPMVAGNPVVEGLEDAINAELWPGYRTELRLAELGDDAALLGISGVAASAGR